MKKIFMFLAGVAAAMAMQAASYSEAVQITMSCDGGAETQQLVLIVDPGLTSPATVANLASSYEVGQVNFYVADGAAKYSQYKANAISNLPVAIVTNRRDVSYTFTFNVPIATDGLVLTDLRSNEGVKAIPMTNGDSYTFSVAGEANYAANTNVTIADRFVINYVAPAPVYDAELTTNADGWASFAWNANLEAVESGLSIYRGDYNDDTANPAIELFELNYVPANAGVFVHGEANTTYHFNAYSGIGVGGLTNDIVACVAAKPVSDFNGDAIYALRYANGATALYQYVGTADIPAHKAVLPIAGLTPSSAPKRISMRINGTQAVDNVEAIAPAEKFVENGQVLIRRGEAVYNLQGQMVK